MNIQSRLARKLSGAGAQVNRTGNSRSGQIFRTVTQGNRTFHQYGSGKNAVRVPMAKSPAPTRSSPGGTTAASAGINYGTHMNSAKGNPRAGSQYQTIQKGSSTYHRYDAEAGGIPAEVYRVKRKK